MVVQYIPRTKLANGLNRVQILISTSKLIPNTGQSPNKHGLTKTQRLPVAEGSLTAGREICFPFFSSGLIPSRLPVYVSKFTDFNSL